MDETGGMVHALAMDSEVDVRCIPHVVLQWFISSFVWHSSTVCLAMCNSVAYVATRQHMRGAPLAGEVSTVVRGGVERLSKHDVLR